mgnify:CR=1 FL=1
MSRWGIGLSEKMKACKEAEPFTDILEGDGGVPEKDPPSSSKAGFKVTTMKIIVWVCILNGLAWVWCSYILALLGREQIAEALSQVALEEIKPDAASDIAYLCGNPDMVDQAFNLLKEAGLPVPHIRREKYVSSR